MEQSKKRKIQHFNNPFATEKCDGCGTSYQAGYPACPHCKKENSHKNRAVPFNETRMMSPGIELAVFLTGWIGFRLIAEIVSFILLRYVGINDYTLMALNYISYGILFLGIIAISFRFLPKLFKTVFRKEVLFGLLVWLAILVFDGEWARISSIFQTSTNINQSTVNIMIKQSPLLAIVFTGFIAPFCEEMTYRCGLFAFGSRINKVLAYVGTAFIFAFIHMHDFTSLNEWLNIPPYVFAGLAFCFAYDRWGLGASLLAHVTNNTIAVLLTMAL